MSGRDEVEEFAALLRRLKDRTDRSYGSLARRVTMNTSTLHRYCAGEAVPQDFAPVERLAAFCEATPQERLELHRLWLAAVAARQRARSPSSGEPAAAPASPSPLPPSSLAQPSSPSASAASPAYSTSAASPASSAPGALPDGSSGPRPRPWYRRRRVWAATAVVCAVLATLRGTNDLPDDRSPQASAVRPGGREPLSPAHPTGR